METGGVAEDQTRKAICSTKYLLVTSYEPTVVNKIYKVLTVMVCVCVFVKIGDKCYKNRVNGSSGSQTCVQKPEELLKIPVLRSLP